MPAESLHPSAGITAVVLAGGLSRRFGSDKLAAVVGGVALLDHLLGSLEPTWPVVAVGPPRATTRPVAWVREEPPGGGPLAGVEAALPLLDAPICAVVAGDMPHAARALPALLTTLLGAPPATAGAVAVDPSGVANPLLSVWRTALLDEGMPRPAANRPARALLDLPHVRVPVDAAVAHDVDTPTDLPG